MTTQVWKVLRLNIVLMQYVSGKLEVRHFSVSATIYWRPTLFYTNFTIKCTAPFTFFTFLPFCTILLPRPRRLRTILIPALLGAPENAQLSEMQQMARDRLLVAIRQAGLGSLLESANETLSHVISKRVKAHQIKPMNKGKKIPTQKRLHSSNGHIVTRSRSTRSPCAR